LDGKITLELDDDVAHKKWGGNWHMPTRAEFQELMDYCTVEWIKLNDNLHACKFTGSNGNSIIMPAAGEKYKSNYDEDYLCYWSSELYMREKPANNHGTSAATLEYSSTTASEISNASRYRGLAVRPVLSDYTPVVMKIEAPTSHTGHDLVDLGLPSGTLWATCNLGASSPEGYGCYYSWGETTGSCDGKTNFAKNNYIYYNGSAMTYYLEQGVTLDPGDDAATSKWGGAWRMPTYSEVSELENSHYTTCEWTTVNGIAGYRVTSIVKGFEGNSIFLPAAGYYDREELKYAGSRGRYWTSILRSSSEDSYLYAGMITISSSSLGKGSTSRWYGFTIRPVVSADAIQ
jgi:hypothetical protein